MEQKRRKHARPLKGASFRFEESLYEDFMNLAKEKGLSSVVALEILMKVALKGILDLSNEEGSYKDIEQADDQNKERILNKFVELASNKPECLPSESKIKDSIKKKRKINALFPKFKVSFDIKQTTVEIVENNKIKVLLAGTEAIKYFEIAGITKTTGENKWSPNQK